jgi:hypothetical protein
MSMLEETIILIREANLDDLLIMDDNERRKKIKRFDKERDG